MEGYRIANFALQSAYLAAQLLFTVKTARIRQATPIWRWFLIFSVSLWLWVSGRFAETVVYLFFPANNDAYVFAANYQYIGLTIAASSYLMWNLHLAGHDRLASNRLCKALIFAYPVIVCLIVFTNEYHYLFYAKLVMGHRVAHGPLFTPLFILSYLLMLAGYFISVTDIIKKREKIGRKLLLLSTFPILPAIAVAVRSISGVDTLDYTPIVMAICFWCLYLVIFKYYYVNIIPASIGAVMEQTAYPIAIYDPHKKAFTYQNQVAKEKYFGALREIATLLPSEGMSFEDMFDGLNLKAVITPIPESGNLLITVTDMTEMAEQLVELDSHIQALEQLSRELDEENRNIDAYLGSIYRAADIQVKQELIVRLYERIYTVFKSMEDHLQAAAKNPSQSEAPLRDNLKVAEDCIAEIRGAVARLREV